MEMDSVLLARGLWAAVAIMDGTWVRRRMDMWCGTLVLQSRHVEIVCDFGEVETRCRTQGSNSHEKSVVNLAHGFLSTRMWHCVCLSDRGATTSSRSSAYGRIPTTNMSQSRFIERNAYSAEILSAFLFLPPFCAWPFCA
jgi:hypothetical protein